METPHKAFDNLVEVMQEGDIVKTATDAADKVENQDTIDACIVGTLADPGEDKIRVSWRTHS